MFYKLLMLVAKGLMKVLFFLEIEGSENVPECGGVVLCANHVSMWDPVACAVAQKRKPAYMAKAEIYKVKILTWFFKSMNVYPVQRGDHGANIRSIITMEQLLKKGNALVIYPEGTRIIKGRRSEPKNGAVRMAIQTEVPIIPVGINGNYKIFRKVKIKFGKPIFYKGVSAAKENSEQINLLTKELMTEIYKLAGRE